VVQEGRNGGAVPELHYSDLAAGQVPGPIADKIRPPRLRVVRGVFPASRIASWNDQIGEYVERNRYGESRRAGSVWTATSPLWPPPLHRSTASTVEASGERAAER